MLALALSLVVASPVQLGVSATAGFGTHTGRNACLDVGSSCTTATARGPAGSFGAFGLYDLGRVAVGVRGETTFVFGDDHSVNPMGLAIARIGHDIFAEAGVGVGWARDTQPGLGPNTSITTQQVGVAGGAGFGAYVVDHVALIVRGGFISGIPGFGYISGGLELSL